MFPYKTIRNDLKQLGSFLKEHGLGRIVSKSNKGVCLMKGKDWDAAKQAWNDENQAELYGTDIYFQILELLLKQRSIQKMRLEQRLLISRLDAEKATSQASVWLAAHHVAVTCKRGQGLQIECSEYYWRMALWELFADISRKRHEFGDQTLKSQTEKFLWGFDMDGVAGAIAGLEKEFGIHYSFDGYQQLSFLLSLCVLRIRKKEYAEIPADFEHQGAEWQGAEYDRSMAGACMESLKKYYNIVFPEGEGQFAVLVLGAAEIQEFTGEASRQTYMEANQNICRVTDKVISITGNILRQGLDRDEYLFDSLILYMKSKMLKLRYNILEENPLKEVVKSKYPNIYAAAWSASLVIESELGVAIPHGAAFCVCHPVIAAAILEEPVDWGRDRRVDRIFLLALNLDERLKAKGQIIRFYSAIVTLLDDEEAYEEFRRLKGQEEIADYLNSMVKGDRKV